VDDTDLIHSTSDPTVEIETLLAEAQQALTLWEELLGATGGALAPEKSYWYLIDVVYKNGNWTYATQEDVPGDLFLQEGAFRVRRQEVSQPNEALGIMTRPDGNMES
jgi:hypothetical protein